MATLKERKAFFAQKDKEPHTIRLGGKKFSMSNLPENIRKRLMDRLAEKCKVLEQGKQGILPGLKIDGKQVTKENIHKFEKSKRKKKSYTKEYLEKLTFSELKKIGRKFGVTDRSKAKLIKEILNSQ